MNKSNIPQILIETTSKMDGTISKMDGTIPKMNHIAQEIDETNNITDLKEIDEFDDFEDDYDDFGDLLSCPEGSKNFGTIHVIKNIRTARIFNEIPNVPSNKSQMFAFIKIMDTLKLIDVDKRIDDILDMSTESLDVLFVSLKVDNLLCVQFCEEVLKTYLNEYLCDFFFSDKMLSYFNENVDSIMIDAFMDEITCDFSDFIIRFITKFLYVINLGEDEYVLKIEEITTSFINYLYKLCTCDFYTAIIKEIGIPRKITLFRGAKTHFKKLINDIMTYVKEKEYDKKIDQINKTYCLLFDNKHVMTHAEGDEIINSISALINLSDHKYFDAMEHFQELFNVCDDDVDFENSNIIALRMSEYPNIFFDTEQKLNNRRILSGYNDAPKFDTSVRSSSITEYYKLYQEPDHNQIIKNRLNKNGFVMEGEKSYKEILTMFEKEKVFSNKEFFLETMAMFMKENKNVVGSYDKYSECDLENAYLLLTIDQDFGNTSMTHGESRGLSMTYDEFVDNVSTTKTLPTIYPMEFVLRLISRICNIKICFF